jgi:hypothetical protein
MCKPIFPPFNPAHFSELLLLSIPLKWPTFSTQTLQLFARLQDALGEQHIIFQLLWALCALQAWQ